MIRSLMISCFLLLGVGLTTAQAQFTVGGVTGGAPAAGVNCYGDADGKISAYAAGWGPEDCGVYTEVCGSQDFNSCTITCGTLATCTAQLTPTITGSCAAATVGTAYTCSGVSATVSSVKPIVYSLAGNPAWLTINANTGVISGTPGILDYADIGSMDVVATAGTVSAQMDVPITVNKAPYFPSITCGAATHGALYNCAAGAVDDDTGDTLTYSLAGNPGWMSIDTNGNLKGTPPAAAVAVSGVVVTATDSTTLTATSSPISISMVDPVQVIVQNINDNATISEASIVAVLSTESETLDSDLTLSNPLHLSFVQNCIGSSTTAASIAACASSVEPVALNQHVVAEIAGGATGTITSALLQDAGVTSGVAGIATGSTCGASGTESCLTLVKASLTSTGAVTTGAIGQVLANYFDGQVTSADTAVPAHSITTGCSSGASTIQVPNPPSICATVHWNCSSNTSGISVVYNDNGKGNIIADPAVFTGSSYQVVATLNIGGAVKTRNVNGSFNVTQAVAGAQNGYKTGSQPAWWRNYNVIERAKNQCAAWGGSITTYAELTAADNQYDLLPNGTRTIFADASGNAFASTGGRQQCSESWPSGPHSLRWYTWAKSQTCKGKAGFGRNFTYVCKDVPSC
jgi:hypothetical protein